jgi:hypothetical protein
MVILEPGPAPPVPGAPAPGGGDGLAQRRGGAGAASAYEQPETATAVNIPAFPWAESTVIGVVVIVGSSNMLQAPVRPVPGAGPDAAAAGIADSATGAAAIVRTANIFAICRFAVVVFILILLCT